MSFAFLYPLAWFGTLAVLVPLWLHLERRREAHLIEFSALRFLDDQPLARSRPWWPRDLPLLLLRAAALLLLVTAFTWPYWLQDEEPDRAIQSTVFLLDNTLSHQAGNQFAAARQELARQLRELPDGDQAAVVEVLASPRIVVPFGTPRDDAVRQVLELSPSHQRGSYRAGFLMASELLRQSLGSERRIVFLGDHQENQWDESGEGAPFLDQVQLDLTTPRQSLLANLSVAQPRLRRQILGDEAIAECLFDVSRCGPVHSATVRVVSGGSQIAEQPIQFAEGESTLTLAFEWPVDPNAWLEGEIQITGPGDALEADNRAYFSLPPVQLGTVHLLADSRYLRTALSPDVMRGRWEVRHLELDELPIASTDFDVLCIESSQLVSTAAWQHLRDALRQEKGVLLILNEAPPLVSERLGRLGIHLREPVEQPGGSRLRFVYRNHPLFFPLSPADFSELLEMEVRRYVRLEVTDGQPLMFSQAGDPLLWQAGQPGIGGVGLGNLFVLGFGLDRTSTNWVLQPTLIPFLDQCLTQSRNLPSQQAEYVPGESCVWNVDAERAVSQVVLRREGEVVDRWPVSQQTARFPIPDQPGLYHVGYDDETLPVAILPVNPDPAESELRFVDPTPLAQRWVYRSLPGEQEEAARNMEKTEPTELPASDLPSSTSLATMDRKVIMSQRVWWWFLLVAGVALLVETTWLTLRQESR